MEFSPEFSQKVLASSSGELPWPLPRRTVHIFSCQANEVSYCIGVSLEQSAKNDPRGILLLRAEKLKRQSSPSFLVEWRIPLEGLTRERAESHFRELETFIFKRARADVIGARRNRDDSASNTGQRKERDNFRRARITLQQTGDAESSS